MDDGVLFLNYISFVVFVNNLPGPLAKALHLRSSFFDAFTDIGSRSAKTFIEAKLKRAASDPAAAHLRSETDGPPSPQALDRWLETSLKVYVLETLQARDDRVLQQLGRQCEQVVSAMQDSLRALIPNFSASLSQAVCFSLAQKFKDLRDDFRAAVSNPAGAFVVALRKAVKLPAMKRTTNPEKFPEEQHATPDEERFVESLSTLLTEELERLSSQNSIFHADGLPVLSYGAWKRCRTLVGSRCLALRQLTGDASKPLLWSSTAGGGRFNGGGQHYVYLKASRSNVGGNAQEYLRRVLKQKLKKSRKSPSVEEHIRQLISSTPPETWPMSSSDVDGFQLDASEEKLGAEMEQ